MNLLRKLFAFFIRDFKIEISYPLSFFMAFLNSCIILFLFFFIGKLIGPDTPGIAKYGKDYFAFVLIGYGFYQFFQITHQSFSNIIEREQYTGCLEAMLATQTPTQQSIVLSIFYSLFSSFLHLLLIFAGGFLFFGLDLESTNLLGALLVFGASLLTFLSFGLLSASFIIVFKRGDPVGWIINGLSFIFSGAFFPVEVMPPGFQTLAKFLPTTYALDALRLCLLKGAPFGQVVHPFLVLLAIGAVCFPISLWALHLSVRKAKKEGTLIFY